MIPYLVLSFLLASCDPTTPTVLSGVAAYRIVCCRYSLRALSLSLDYANHFLHLVRDQSF